MFRNWEPGRTTLISHLVLFGATGDLAQRYLFPALATMQEEGSLPDGFLLVGSATADLDDESFRRSAAEALELHAPGVPASARNALVDTFHYRQADVLDSAAVAGLIDYASRDLAGTARGSPVAVYLALPPAIFGPAVTAIAAAGLPEGSRVVLEKPFGEDLRSAMDLKALIARELGESGARAVFLVDHVLGMPAAQNLLGLRFANSLLEAVWNTEHIQEIEILWEETIALEGRAAFYDQVGALKDVMQNHMLQLLSLLAMEPPDSLDEAELHDRKVEALRAVRSPTRAEIPAATRRARYGPGRLASSGEADGRRVPAYAEEEGIDPDRGTETFAEVTLELANERWSGTRFRLRAGKAMAARRKGVLVRFRRPPVSLFGGNHEAGLLWIGVDGPLDITLTLNGVTAGRAPSLVPLQLAGEPPASKLPAYGHVLVDILSGDSTLSVRGDEAVEAWRVVMPVVEAWGENLVPIEEYPAGSPGP